MSRYVSWLSKRVNTEKIADKVLLISAMLIAAAVTRQLEIESWLLDLLAFFLIGIVSYLVIGFAYVIISAAISEKVRK
ncbi:MAG: hypothetical protein LBV19_07055 [Streptococcaceae bacterium]|jgi:hypothetical protein|nr:hypothetical protein [Streptococcaceae bacterium]